jgi:hypothetical protein
LSKRSACGCRLCAGGPADDLDDGDRKLLSDVERHGWHVVNILAANDIPGWSFTVGLTHSFGTPELATFGLPEGVGHQILNTLGELVRNGSPLTPGSRLADVLEAYNVELQAADAAWNHALFGYATWFYRPREPGFLQCVWPDKSGRFPWEPGFEARLLRLQPALLASPPQAPVGPWRAWAYECQWPPRSLASGLVFVSTRAVSGEAPILGVKVFSDGDWAFLDGGPARPDDMNLSHLHHVLEADPSLEEMIGLKPGTIAWRGGPGEAWTVSPVSEEG